MRKSATYVDVYTYIYIYMYIYICIIISHNIIIVTLATVVSILFRVRPDIAWQRQF